MPLHRNNYADPLRRLLCDLHAHDFGHSYAHFDAQPYADGDADEYPLRRLLAHADAHDLPHLHPHGFHVSHTLGNSDFNSDTKAVPALH